jgi:hypothetical protein
LKQEAILVELRIDTAEWADVDFTLEIESFADANNFAEVVDASV